MNEKKHKIFKQEPVVDMGKPSSQLIKVVYLIKGDCTPIIFLMEES